jgi:hypothetical protein
MRKPYHEKEAAEFLGLKRQTLANWRHLGKGPVYRKLSPGPRGRVVYFPEDLQAYLDRCRIDPEPV